MIRFITILCIFIFNLTFFSHAINIVKADIIAKKHQTEFYLRLDKKPLKHKTFFLKNPDRKIIDLHNTVWKAKKIPIKGCIKNIRFGRQKENFGRIVLDLKHQSYLQYFDITPHPRVKAYWLLKMILSHGPVTSYQNNKKPAQQTQPPIKVKKYKFKSKHTFKPYFKPKDTVLIMIDPGHGGNDPGAISINKYKEKDIVLKFSKELAHKINQKKGLHAILTRDKDFYIPLSERVAIAQHYKADLFISIHADALRGKKAKGATIYTLSDKASDQVAAQIAHNENQSDIAGGIFSDNLPSGEVKDILIDLLQKETAGYSHDLAEYMVKDISKVTTMMRHPHRQASFAVLKAPDIPSILLELGYLTNLEDEKNLINPNWRKKMVGKIISSVQKWHKTRKRNLI